MNFIATHIVTDRDTGIETLVMANMMGGYVTLAHFKRHGLKVSSFLPVNAGTVRPWQIAIVDALDGRWKISPKKESENV